MIPAELEEKIYDEYMRVHRTERIPMHVTDAVGYLDEHTVAYAEKVPKKGIPIERYCVGTRCFDTIAHRDYFYKHYPDIVPILKEIEEKHLFTYRYVVFDLLTCCTSVTFEKEGIMIWRYIRNVSKAEAGFFDTPLDEWAVGTAIEVWDEICPAECDKIGGTVEAVICPDEDERGFSDGVYIVAYSEVDHKKNVIGRYVSDSNDRPRIESGKRVYTGSVDQEKWSRT